MGFLALHLLILPALAASPIPKVDAIDVRPASIRSTGANGNVMVTNAVRLDYGVINLSQAPKPSVQQTFPQSMQKILMGTPPAGTAPSHRYLGNLEFVETMILEPRVYAQGPAVLLRNTANDLVVWRPTSQSAQAVGEDVLSMTRLSRSQALLLLKGGALAMLDDAGVLTSLMPAQWLPGITGNITGIAVAEVGSLSPFWVSLYGITDAGEVFYVTYNQAPGHSSSIKEFAKLEFPRVGQGPVKDELGNVLSGLGGGIDFLRVSCQRGRYPRFTAIGETVDPATGAVSQHLVTFLNSGLSAIRYQAHFRPGTSLGKTVTGGPYLLRSGSRRARTGIDAEFLGYAHAGAASDRVYLREGKDLVSYDSHGTQRVVEELGLFSQLSLATLGSFPQVMPGTVVYLDSVSISFPAPSLPLQMAVPTAAAPRVVPSTPRGSLQSALFNAASQSAPSPPPQAARPPQAVVAPAAKPRNILLEDPTTAQGWIDYLRAEVAKVDREYGFRYSARIAGRMPYRRDFLAAVNATQVFRYHIGHYTTRAQLRALGFEFQSGALTLAAGADEDMTIDLDRLGLALQQGKEARDAAGCADLLEYWLR